MNTMRSTFAASLALVLILASAPGAVAQELRTGDRIRVKTVSDQIGELVGVYQASEPDYLVIHRGQSTPANIPWNDISRLQRSLGEKSNAGKGALIGLGIGGGIGLVIGVIAVAQGDQESGWLVLEGPSAGEAAVGAVALAAFGAGLGALIGLASESERWETIPRGKWQIQVAPDPKGGVALALSLRL